MALLCVSIVLDGSGSCRQQHRIQLLKRLLPLLENFTIGGLLADREFIGQEWFQFLEAQKIPPFIRLNADTRVNGQPVWSCFKKMAPLEVRYWHRPMKLYGVRFRVMATKSHKGEMLYLAYSGRRDQALKWYAKRWNAENLHAALKSRGFHLEESGLYQPQRVAVLLTCVTLAFVWCCLTDEWAERQRPSQPLKHGYPAKSLFRRGLDLLQEDFLQSNRTPDPGGLPVFEVLH